MDTNELIQSLSPDQITALDAYGNDIRQRLAASYVERLSELEAMVEAATREKREALQTLVDSKDATLEETVNHLRDEREIALGKLSVERDVQEGGLNAKIAALTAELEATKGELARVSGLFATSKEKVKQAVIAAGQILASIQGGIVELEKSDVERRREELSAQRAVLDEQLRSL